ncbi:MAG: glutamine--fructose-6-phosphate aminotransferase, partial [Acidimicrobiia bacterium]|nr:glutamine--fructose-6-phosphate aminotransferase [Acidimicrobiia bacterium]
MCGIVGYVGSRDAQGVLMSSLRRLEYRGYDSAGIAITNNGRIEVQKSAGKLQRLDDMLVGNPMAGKVGIGHTRWATHGVPNDANAHPHVDASGEFVLVHNGIIENFLPLKEKLLEDGHVFHSDTDTEVLVHLVAAEYEGDLVEAVRRAIRRATGAYALVVMTSREPGRVVAARMISPLVVGFGDGETFLASDIPAILPYTRTVLVIDDGEMVDITAQGATVQTIDGEIVDREPMEVTWDAGQAEKGGFPHFMLKEIYEQPGVIEETLRGRLQPDGTAVLEGVD